MRHILFCLAALGGALLAGPALGADRPGLFLRPGDSVIFTLEDGQPVNARPAAEGDQPTGGEIKAEMNVTGGQTMLVVKNGSDRAFNYRAFIVRKADDRGERTSVCTLQPGLLMFESWPGRLPGLRISDFEPGESGQMICR
jgi:hypothetical protein